jgi:hypothetical protein
MRYIYIYDTPSSRDQGLIKIGDALNVDQRILEQFNTAAATDVGHLAFEKLYVCEAVKADGTEFRDHHIHAALASKGYAKHQIRDGDITVKGATEWFKISWEKAAKLIEGIKKGMSPEEIDIDRFWDFPMRPEQEAAVEKTKAFFEESCEVFQPVEFLWNAKMRFGKTFTAYHLAKSMNLSRVLVLTYKPAVEDAWQKDLESHVDFSDYVFLRREGLSDIGNYLSRDKKVVAFASYQDLLGQKDADTQIKDKHVQLFDERWDLVIIDEFHYGAGTKKAKEILADQLEAQNVSKKEISQIIGKELFSEEDEEIAEEAESLRALEVAKQISSRFRLYLSGTPFKAMANAQFDSRAIFNWTYTDEQKAKEQWNLDHPGQELDNPYRSLPQIHLYLYKVHSDIISAGLQEGKDEFSLNHFFKTEKKKFVNEEAVGKWLNLISGVIRPHKEIEDELHEEVRCQASQYPFDHEGLLFEKLDHTLWYLNRVDSAIALKELLEKHVIFKDFHIILAAGKGMKSGVDAVQPVLDEIDRHKKTITLSVGKLTTGVSIPKWKGVLFLRDVSSPENYFQTAFRAQTPFIDKKTGKMKDECYIFDFSPNRALRLLTTYSEKLSADSFLSTSEEKISEFIRYLPVLQIYGNRMVSLNARDVLTFDLSGIDAKGLGDRFVERKNIVLNRDTFNAINANSETQSRCQDIFDRIKKFRKYNGASDKEQADVDVDVANLDVNDKKIRALETKEPSTPKEKEEKDKETVAAEKQLKSEREKIRELLRTLLSRLPIFMYLTDATEENLEQVLIETEDDLFRKTTGIEIEDFRFLVDMGLLRIESLDGYILKFVKLENQNYDQFNIMRGLILK